MDPLVSILIPAYNSRQWIADTIESALAQTWPRKEIIVVDDGSTDDTFAIASAFGPQGVIVKRQENQGAAWARNTAYSLCQGAFIQWLDADDLLAPDKIERQMRVALATPGRDRLFSGEWGYFMYRPSKAVFTPSPLWADLTPAEWLLRKLSLNLHMQTDNWLVSRELTDAAGPWDVRLFRDNDGEYFTRVIRKCSGVKFVPGARSYYRRAGYKSISHIGGSNRKLVSLLISMKFHIECMLSLADNEKSRQACITYLGNWVHEFNPHRPDLVDQLRDLAASLGGILREPVLPLKYRWIANLFGINAGRRAQAILPRLKTTTLISWDRLMYRLQRERIDAGSCPVR